MGSSLNSSHYESTGLDSAQYFETMMQAVEYKSALSEQGRLTASKILALESKPTMAIWESAVPLLSCCSGRAVTSSMAHGR